MKIKPLTSALITTLLVSPMIFSTPIHTNHQKLNKLENLVSVDKHSIPDISYSSFDSILPVLPSQLQAWQNFKLQNPNAVVRWNRATGSIDSLFGIAIPLNGNHLEQAGLSFIQQYQSLLNASGELRLNPSRSKEALGGRLLRFDQFHQGVPIEHHGIGLIIDENNRVRGLLGSTRSTVSLNVTPTLNATDAIVIANQNLSAFTKALPPQALSVLQPAFDTIKSQLGVFSTPTPELIITHKHGKPLLAWRFFNYSENPFGVFRFVIDAKTGEVISREDQVRTAESSEPTDQYADYFPTFPAITDGLKNDCAIWDENDQEIDTPQGQLRIQLRKFDQSNRVSGVEGVLTGKHALIQNALPTKLPFLQAAQGTYYFDKEELPLKGRTNERDHLAEPSEHQDGISQFIYITNLMEYLDYLHKDGDAVHSRGLGSGSFPDSYPNESVPLMGTVHIPNVLDAPTDVDGPDYLARLMGLDNAFAVPLSQNIGGQEVVVNPTFYGHGYLFNNLAIDFSVPMHEGTHATITPIAGFEGSPEGGALNEGQADLWAYTIGEMPDLGTYPVNACGLRQYLSENNVDPESFKYIRSAQSQIRYSQLGTRDNTFEVHRDGEIYAGAMWDLRELMIALYPQEQFVRPDPISGNATQPTSLGKETWERIFLGSMYILGATSPDTMVKSRDALLIADSILYPSNPMDVSAPGIHHALIERVFAAREIGLHAQAPLGGRQSISTAVSEFTAAQAQPEAPQSVVAKIVDAKTVEVNWQPVNGSFAYQVLKRRTGDPSRLFLGVDNREYFDSDLEFNGYTHVEFVIGSTQTSYQDHGQGYGRGPGQGLDSLSYEYVVRSIKLADNGQVGFSKLSGTARTSLRLRNVTQSVNHQITDVSFNNGVFSFNQTLTNNGSTALYAPLEFKIVKISNPTITVLNADNQGTGQQGDPALFVYNQSLEPNEQSIAKLLKFNNPNGQLFTFKARIRAAVAGTPKAGNGSQEPIDSSAAVERPVTYHAMNHYEGLVLLGSTDQVLIDGVDYQDIHFTAKASANSVTATLSADPELGGAYPDLDFQLLDSEGNIIDSSGNLGPNETVGAGLIGGETYTFRVIGWANGPTRFYIVSDQMVTDPNDASSSDTQVSNEEEWMFQFTVDPQTQSINGNLLN